MLGVSTNCLHHIPLEEALEALVPVTDMVEVMDDGLHYLESADLLEQYSFDFSLHAPAKGVNIASQLPPIRRASVEVIAASFAIAAEIDALDVQPQPRGVGAPSEAHPQVVMGEPCEVLVQRVTIGGAQHVDQMGHGCSFSGVLVRQPITGLLRCNRGLPRIPEPLSCPP